jgi:chromatin remodeling complex protein RSC6
MAKTAKKNAGKTAARKKTAGTASRKTARKTTARAGAAKKSAARKGAGRKTAARSSAKKTAGKAGGRKTARTPNAAFMRPVTPSPALAEVVGAAPVPRTEVTRKLWVYIKKNGLQDQKNRRMIKSDAKLKPIFGGRPAVNMFEMTKLVGKHLA